jgi:hypothetical protein
MLSPEREVVLSPLLRELDLEAPSFGGLRLPLAAWAVAVGGRALVLTLRRRYPSPAESARLDAAAALLGELAARHPLVVAVTHASVRAQLCARLACSGWVGEPGRRTRRNWSAWLLTQGGGGLARIEERSP